MAPAPPSGIHSTPLLTNVDTAAPAQQRASLGSEQRLIDFIAGLQAQGLTTQQFSNPAGLASEALRALDGYFERVNSMNDQMRRAVNRTNQNEDLGSLSHAEQETQALPGGPASQTLDAVVTSGNDEAGSVNKVTMNEIERLYDKLVDWAEFGAVTAIVSTASESVSRSTMTLVRGA